MHGLIFTSFQNYLDTAFGDRAMAEILAGEPIYLLSEAYDDARLNRLVERTAEVTGKDPAQILYDFGVFTGETTFPRLYPAYYHIAGGTRAFLFTVEERIHELVRATFEKADPPQLSVLELGDESVLISYTSPRRLCVLLRGLVEGTARHYDEHADIVERRCMLRGDDACRVEVRVAQPTSRATPKPE